MEPKRTVWARTVWMMRTKRWTNALATASALCAVIAAASLHGQSKSDPLYQSKGDQKRTYTFQPTGDRLPYRTYVPSTWSPGMKLPLVLVLHGGGLDENAPFERSPAPMSNELQKLAEEFHYIIVSPLGWTMSGGFGAPPPPDAPGGPAGPGGPGPGGPGAAPRPAGAPPPMPRSPRDDNPKSHEYSEQDVMDVVAIVEKEYGVDTTKEFITGNSMGAIGTMYIASRHPEKWVAMAPSEGGYDPARYGKYTFGVKGALLIHKQDDKAPQVETQSAEMVKVLSAEGINAKTISVPGTVHENVWFFALPTTLHFFDAYVHPPMEHAGLPPR